MNQALQFIASIFLILSCNVSPAPIDYGHDDCHSCKMTIVDPQHAAQVVTHKGKVFTFDAIECMVPFVIEQGEDEFKFILVNHYSNPGELIDAKKVQYLISQNLPSPMGEFLTGFENEEELKNIQLEKGGTAHNWSDLIIRFTERFSNL